MTQPPLIMLPQMTESILKTTNYMTQLHPVKPIIIVGNYYCTVMRSNLVQYYGKVEVLGLTLMSFLSSVEWILMPDWLVEASEFMIK